MGRVADPLEQEDLLNRIAVAIRDLHDETKIDVKGLAEACSTDKLRWRNDKLAVLTAREVRTMIRDTKHRLGIRQH